MIARPRLREGVVKIFPTKTWAKEIVFSFLGTSAWSNCAWTLLWVSSKKESSSQILWRGPTMWRRKTPHPLPGFLSCPPSGKSERKSFREEEKKYQNFSKVKSVTTGMAPNGAPRGERVGDRIWEGKRAWRRSEGDSFEEPTSCLPVGTAEWKKETEKEWNDSEAAEVFIGKKRLQKGTMV